MARRGLIAFIIVAVLLVASLAGAFVLLNDGMAKGKTGQGTVIIDDRGKNVTVPENPQRIISLGSSFTEIIFDLGHRDDVVAVDYSSMVMVGDSDNIADLGSVSSLGVESILSLDPDCVVIWNFNMYQTFIGSMEEADIPVLAFYPKNVTDVLNTITRLGTAIGERDKAVDMVADIQERIDSITALTSAIPDSEKPKVYLELKTMGGRAAGINTISDELIVMAGGINICNDVSGTWDVEESVVVSRNPDIIVIENGGRSNADLERLLEPVNAVRNNEIHRIADGTLTTSPSMVDALENLAKWFHPELFD